MPSALCETCTIVYQDGKKFCRVCGGALRVNFALRPGVPLCSCAACALRYLDERNACAFCGQLLARPVEPISDARGGLAPVAEPPATSKSLARADARAFAQPLEALPQGSLSPAELPVLFQSADQQPLGTHPEPESRPSSRLRPAVTVILTSLLIAALGIAGMFWGTSLNDLLWDRPASQSAPTRATGVEGPSPTVTAPPASPTSPAHPSKADAHNARGVDLAQAGNIEGAIAEFRRAVAADPKSFKAHNNLGVLYKQKGMTAQAVNQYRAASKIEPTNPVPYKNLAILYEDQGRLADALRNYARYLELAPSASDADVIRSKVLDLQSKVESKPRR